MTDVKNALDAVGADHSPLDVVLIRMTDLERRRSRRAAVLASVGVGMAVAAVAGSILVLRPAGTAPQHVEPATAGIPASDSSAPQPSDDLPLGASATPVPGSEVEAAGAGAAARSRAEEQRRQAAAAAMADELARARAAASARAAAQSSTGADAVRPAAVQREATALSRCQYLLSTATTSVLHNGVVDAEGAVRLARSCLGGDPTTVASVSWVVTGMDQLSDALGYDQQPVSTDVAVVQLVAADALGSPRRWLIVVLPNDAHRTIGGRSDGEPTVQQYPVVVETPDGFDLAQLGTVHRP